MSVTDPIADMLTILRNASTAKKKAVEVKRSKIALEIIKILKEEGFIENYREIEDKKQGIIKIYLKFIEGEPAIKGIRKESKPGRRTYKSASDIKKVLGGIGIGIYSTPKGLLTDTRCREQNIGGEYICSVW